MRHMIWILFVVVAVGFFALTSGRDPNAQTTAEPQVTNLSVTNLAGSEGKLPNVSTVEVAPGTADVLYFRPGGEVLYVLEGAGTLRTPGTPPVALKAGTVVEIAPRHSHIITNTSPTRTLKVLVVELAKAGQPHVVLAKTATRQQKEARQQSEGCQVAPNDMSQQKMKEPESSIMKGLVF